MTAGTLIVDGQIGAGAVSVSSGATLGGTGTIGGTVTVANNGKLAPATNGTTGTLTVAGLTLSTLSQLNYDFAEAGHDMVAVTGMLNINGGKLSITDLGLVLGTHTVIDYAGTPSGSVANMSLGTPPPAGYTWQLADNVPATAIELTISGGLDFGDAPTPYPPCWLPTARVTSHRARVLDPRVTPKTMGNRLRIQTVMAATKTVYCLVALG